MTGLPRLDLVCFGPPTARVGGGEPAPEVLWRKHLGLLIYLALSPGRVRARDHLLGLLWPEKDQSQARHSLNEAVRRLRRCLGEGRLRSRGDASIELDGTALEVDATRFLEMAERDPGHAVTVATGDFLEGFALDDAPGFEEWASGERDRYRSRVAAALVQAGERELSASRFGAAGDVARRALSLQPFAEPAVRLLMRAAALAGDAPGALAAYRDFGTRLADGIGEKPSRELTALAERVRHQTWRPAVRVQQEPEPPLVGREEAYQEVFRLLAAGLERGPRTLFVAGGPGMGRSRLLGTCVDRLALEGAVTVTARPLASDVDARWSTLRQLMRAGLAAAPGLVGASPEALGVLGSLVPELAQRFPAREAQDDGQIASALAAAIKAAAEERPLALAVDDAHLADGATLAALAAAMEAIRQSRLVLLVGALEPAEGAPAELLWLRGAVGRTISGTAIRLEPLAADDLRSLVAALATWCHDPDQRDRLARRLAQETGGNPFFAVTLLRSLERMTLRDDFIAWPLARATFESPLPFTLPELVRTAIAVRLGELDGESQRVVAAASVTGQAVDLDLVADLLELPRARVEECLAPAERRHLIRFENDRYVFAAPLIAEVVRAECLTPGQRQALGRRAVERLGTRDDLDARLLRAELLARVDPGPAAFAEAVALARAAGRDAGTRAARRALATAERAAGKAPSEEERRVLEELREQMTR